MLAQNGHADRIPRCPLLAVKRKTSARGEYFRFRPRPRENVRARRARRIVFFIVLSRQPSPALLFSKLIEVERKFPFVNSISEFSRSQDPQQNSRSGCLFFRTAHECSITTQCLRSPAGRIESWRRGAGSRSPTIGRRALR